jgi:hypothetical protein
MGCAKESMSYIGHWFDQRPFCDRNFTQGDGSSSARNKSVHLAVGEQFLLQQLLQQFMRRFGTLGAAKRKLSEEYGDKLKTDAFLKMMGQYLTEGQGRYLFVKLGGRLDTGSVSVTALFVRLEAAWANRAKNQSLSAR